MNTVHKLNLTSLKNLVEGLRAENADMAERIERFPHQLANFLEEFKQPAITEYRCGSCGDFFPGDMLSDASYRDWQNGDWVQMLMCDPCKLKRKHELLR